MPHFYLNIRNGDGDQVDHTGIDCADARAAMAEAAMTAGEIMRDELHDRLSEFSVRMTIETERRETVGTINVSVSMAAT